MVVVLTRTPVTGAEHDLKQCSAAPPATFGRKLTKPCSLPAGHVGYHETHVRVARANGALAGYTYSWLT